MLTELQIKNVAIIDDITIEFGNGFNVLTGETGAGKSILIDSINMALGGRTNKDLVRTGAEYAHVQAVFEIKPEIFGKLEEYEIEPEDGCLILSRKVTADGRSTCRINGRTTLLSIVKEVAEMLLNIHGQQDNQALLKPDSHREFLDSYADNFTILKKYNEKYYTYINLIKEYKNLRQLESDRGHRLEFLKYSYQEICDAKLTINEEEELEKRQGFLSNIEGIISNVSNAYSCLYGDEISNSAYDMVSDATNYLQNASEYDKKLLGFYDTMSSVLADVEDVTHELKSYIDAIDYENGELDLINERLSFITGLKRKFKLLNVEDIITYGEKCKEEIENIENLDDKIDQLKKEVSNARKELEEVGITLTDSRQKASIKLSKAIMNELVELDMGSVVFSVNITEKEYSSSGCDNVEFLISTNPGESLKPLTKIASGGEMSRIMLAIKSILSESDIVDTMIFDEIDTGVSGRAAQKISEKICRISRSKQVLCITHLAQIASMGDRQYLIEKVSDKNNTRTNVKMLTKAERCDELSRIIGGVEVTETTQKVAAEMLEQAQLLKAKQSIV